MITLELKIPDYTAFKQMDLPTLDHTVVMHALFDVLDPSLFMALAMCSADNSSEDHCTAECREGLINLKAAIGCCYQSMYNTPYFIQLVHARIITPSFFTQFVCFNDPNSNPWKTCGVKTPQRCPTHPFSDGGLANLVMFLLFNWT